MFERVVVLGSSGSGKTTFSKRLAAAGWAYLELDSIWHQPGWATRPKPEMREEIATFVSEHDRWVVDGNYAEYRQLLWGAANTVVWLDLDRRVVMRSLLMRTLRRTLTREELWNGNREPWSNLTSLDPEKSVLAWSWTRFHAYRADYAAQMTRWPNLRWVRLRARSEVEELVARLTR